MPRIQAGQPVTHLDHQDPWTRVREAYGKMKNPTNLAVQKVKAHTSKKAVEEGLLTEERRINEQVDLEAKAAAREFLVEKNVKSALLKRLSITAATQRMVLAILEARREQFEELKREFPIESEESAAAYDAYLQQQFEADDEEKAPTERVTPPAEQGLWEEGWDDLLEQWEKRGDQHHDDDVAGSWDDLGVDEEIMPTTIRSGPSVELPATEAVLRGNRPQTQRFRARSLPKGIVEISLVESADQGAAKQESKEHNEVMAGVGRL